MMLTCRARSCVVAFSTLLLFFGCSTTKKDEPQVLSSTTTKTGSVVVTDEMIGRSRGSMSLLHVAAMASYAYSEAVPVKIGGGFGEGSQRTYQYLNALRGPNGETVKYNRIG